MKRNNKTSHTIHNILKRTIIEPHDFMAKLSLTKSESWAYEKEWRIILTHEWPNEFGDPSIHFIQKAVGIYLGARIHEDDKAKLCTIAKEKGIPVYQMYPEYLKISMISSPNPQK